MRQGKNYRRIIGVICLAFVLMMITSCSKKSENEKAFIEACKIGDLTEVQMLVEDRVDIDAQDRGGNSAIRWACYQRHNDVVRYLLSEGVDVNAANKNGQTPLIAAAYSGTRSITEMLLATDTDINARDKKGKTALSWSISRRNFEVRDVLIEYGASE